MLWRERVRFALDLTKTETANKDLDCFERWVGPKLPTFELNIRVLFLGWVW